MNSLNSVLLEGKVMAKPSLNGGICRFPIENDKVAFTIETKERLAEVCSEYLDKGRGVRVVGRLKNDGNNVYIYGEHVEFRPIK